MITPRCPPKVLQLATPVLISHTLTTLSMPPEIRRLPLSERALIPRQKQAGPPPYLYSIARTAYNIINSKITNNALVDNLSTSYQQVVDKWWISGA